MEIAVRLTVETSQSEVQELRLTADYRPEVQSILVKAFAEDGLASAPASEIPEQQLVTIEVKQDNLSRAIDQTVWRVLPYPTVCINHHPEPVSPKARLFIDVHVVGTLFARYFQHRTSPFFGTHTRVAVPYRCNAMTG